MRKLAFLLALAVPACAGKPTPPPVAAPEPPKAVDFRDTPPPAGPTAFLAAPTPLSRALPNGLTVLVVPKRDLPLVAVRVVFKAGSASDPASLPGVAAFTGDLLRAGTRTRKATAIADAVETLGSRLEVSVDEDTLSVGATALTTSFGGVFDVLADVLQSSTFAADELERSRKRRLAAYAQETDDPESLAERVTREVVYGKHPYGHSTLGDDASLARISRADVVAWAEAHLRPANAAVIVAGDVDPELAVAEVEKRLGSWKGKPGAEPPPAAPKPQPPDVVLVPRPGAPQSQLRLSHLGIARTAPDYESTLVMNEILGGMFSSRINLNLRESKGYTYGAYSYFDANRAPGSFVAGAGVRTDATAQSVHEVLAEIDGMRDRDVTDEELRHAKDGFALSLPGRFQTIGSLAGMVSNVWVQGFPLDYYSQLPARVQAVTIADVRRAAQVHLIPEQLSIVVVGDPAVVAEGLTALGRGELELRAADGKPAAPRAAGK
jgi:zinc protease